MTAYTLFSQSLTDRGAVTTDASPYTLGVQFSVSTSVPLTGIWFYSGTGAAVLPSECLIFDADTTAQVAGTLNNSPSWSGAAGSGWVKCTYDGSVTLSSGVNYVAAVFSPLASNWYSDVDSANYWTSGPGASGITSGPLSAPNSAGALHGQAVFNAGSTLTFPTTTFSGYDFAVDVEVTAAPPPFAVYQSTAGDGTQTWSVTSSLNGPGASTLRILPPSSPNLAYPHSFLIALPVSTGTDATYGDPVTVIGDDLGAHNAYNTTVAVPSFPTPPWYADNPGNTAQSQESFVLALATWLSTSVFASGGEKNYLIGFSKSGLGGQGLQFRNPSVFAKTASWDAPFMATALDTGGDDLTDPTYGSAVGGSPAEVYGTDASFQANYRLSTANLTAWRNAANFASVQRLWIGGYYTFGADVTAYEALLSGLGILYSGAWDTLDASHAWHDDWVAPALAWMFPAFSPPGPPLLPPGISSPMALARRPWRSFPASTVTGAEAATGTDSGTLAVTAGGADTGSGTDTSALTVTATGAETGTGADTVTAIGLASGDTASLADTASVTASLAGTDTGSAAEAGTVAAAVAGADAGTGTDSGSGGALSSLPAASGLGGTAASVSTYGGSAVNLNTYGGSAQ